MYLDTTHNGYEASQAFRHAYSIPVPIEFVSVWETVASVGWTFKHFLFSSSNRIVRHFRYALALDEHRIEFMPNPRRDHPKGPHTVNHGPGWETEVIEDDFEYHLDKPTDNVGGGSNQSNDIHTLANPSFQWMVSEVLRNAPYVLFRPDAFGPEKGFSALTITKTDLVPKPARSQVPSTFRRAATSDPSPALTTRSLPFGNASDGSAALNEMEVEEEQMVVVVEQIDPAADANAPMTDQVVEGPVWLNLEYIPFSQ
ncbi:hypothetical protein M407DRAFT_21035 [Tulasnella calospora MUT 4182]|uniref:T6SS Phospholipase effector Tle1-like catalytic domain-containing protein n=1 Tax=Tulasnella calospora MUT 4182 TaxID=1051891 RepID=A0A0C3QNS4_9AGAM|nr:hypothetical protein M407DRAFT_21035 [Tulasnella calospora MUT 4182]